MLRGILPKAFKRGLRSEFRRLLLAELRELTGSADLPGELREFIRPAYIDGHFPHHPDPCTYTHDQGKDGCPTDPETKLPVPPRELQLDYGNDTEAFLRTGEGQVATMRRVVAESGEPLESARRIVELGCATGRMLRWLHDLTGGREIWGLDITAAHVNWCKRFLSPPFHFATTTTFPHLPFEDRYFDFLYAGSVFTHITDLADAWFLELRRIIRPGGRLYLTIHDRHTMEVLDRPPEYPLATMLRSVPEYHRLRRTEFEVLTVGGKEWGLVFVFHDLACLRRRLEPFFRTLSVTPEAYAYQTALLLERR